MKLFTKILPITTLMLSTSVSVFAGTPARSEKAVNIPPPVAESRWSIGVGMVARQIGTDFNIKGPGALNTNGLFNRRSGSGRGDVGFFRGGNNTNPSLGEPGGDGTVIYDNGFVGGQYYDSVMGIPDGTAYGTINSASQLVSNGRNSGGQNPVTGQNAGDNGLYDLTFYSHNTSYQYLNNYTSTPFNTSDNEVGVGPYIELRYAIFQAPHFDVNILFGYSWTSADLGSGDGVTAIQTVTQKMTSNRYGYTYDYNPFWTDLDPATSTFPFIDDQSSTIFDAALFNSSYPGAQAVAPRKRHSSRTSNKTVASFYAIGSATLDVDLHELILAPEIMFDIANRFRAGVTVGPTLNIIETGLDTHVAWYNTSSHKPVATASASSNETTVKLGVAAQVTAQYDITKRVYVEASASYRYVPSFDVRSGSATASVDTASFQGAVGLGFRL